MGDLFVKVLIVEYLIITIAYLIQGNFAKVLYFVGAIILSLGVLMMK